MDPKPLSGLDPKLQATYDRIMNVTTPPAGSTPSTNQSAPSQQPTSGQVASYAPSTPLNTPANEHQQTMNDFTQPIKPPQSTNPYAYPSASPGTFSMAQQATPAPTTTAPNLDVPINKPQSSQMIKIIYIVGAIVFFITYTIFWIKIFKLPVPLPF